MSHQLFKVCKIDSRLQGLIHSAPYSEHSPLTNTAEYLNPTDGVFHSDPDMREFSVLFLLVIGQGVVASASLVHEPALFGVFPSPCAVRTLGDILVPVKHFMECVFIQYPLVVY